MSIYSGFATRNLEQYYDQVLYSVISTLLTRITKFYRNEHVDERSFHKIISSQEKTLRKLEKRKVSNFGFSTFNPSMRSYCKASRRQWLTI